MFFYALATSEVHKWYLQVCMSAECAEITQNWYIFYLLTAKVYESIWFTRSIRPFADTTSNKPLHIDNKRILSSRKHGLHFTTGKLRRLVSRKILQSVAVK